MEGEPPVSTPPKVADRYQIQVGKFNIPSPTPRPTSSPTPVPTPGQFFCLDSKVISPEPGIIWAVSPDPGGTVGPGQMIKVWYNDEYALTLGKETADAPVTRSPTGKDHAVNPKVGALNARDPAGYPYFPALFISDVTDDPNNRSGDAKNGGKAYLLDEIYGAWQYLGCQSFCSQTNWLYLPSEADPMPKTSNTGADKYYRESNYAAEIIWHVDSLGLKSGRTYRAQFVVHDGDMIGDLSVGCMVIRT